MERRLMARQAGSESINSLTPQCGELQRARAGQAGSFPALHGQCNGELYRPSGRLRYQAVAAGRRRDAQGSDPAMGNAQPTTLRNVDGCSVTVRTPYWRPSQLVRTPRP
jgi:hypothetical protein